MSNKLDSNLEMATRLAKAYCPKQYYRNSEKFARWECGLCDGLEKCVPYMDSEEYKHGYNIGLANSQNNN